MSTDDVIKIVAGILVGVAALLSLGFGIYQYAARRRQESRTEIIQGEKETAAAAAVRIRSMKRSPRSQELQALCLASVFERSGRTRSLIHAALKAQQVNHPDVIRDIVDQITVVIGRNASYTDLTRARRRLISLRSALSLDGDTRTRIDAIEIYTGAARTEGETPCGCKHEAHSWAQVRQPLLLLGKLVLVCRTQEKDSPNQSDRALGVPVITLDYHRTLAGSLSSYGQTLVDGKYAKHPRQADVGLEQLANRLQLVIRTVESYSSADAIAVIPGTEHQYSDDLGKKLSEKTGLPLVALLLEKGTRNFAVDRKNSEHRTFILIDDVYRTGRTFRDAASCLFAEGAMQVLGLAATCTISRIDLPCHHGHLADFDRLRMRSQREKRVKLASDYLREIQHEGGLSSACVDRTIERLHAEHARWLVAGERSSDS